MTHYYPPLDPETIRNLEVVRALASEAPDYFEGSPYSPELEKLLKAVPARQEVSKRVTSENVNVLHEVTETYNDLKLHKPPADDAAATMGYYRTRTNLLEKLTELLDRGKNQKAISEFYAEVLSILDDISTPTQRAEFADRLKAFAEK